MIINNATSVKRLLNEGQSPFLSFEKDLLLREFKDLGGQQRDLARLLAEAMDQSSETWHDNAPADAINHQSKVVSDRARKVISELGSAVLIGYPRPESEIITLGSIVGITYPGESEVENLLLTGLCRTAPELSSDAPFPTEDLTIVTARSPLGEAMIELKVGSVASYEANTHTLSVEIATVHQLDPQYLTGSQQSAS